MPLPPTVFFTIVIVPLLRVFVNVQVTLVPERTLTVRLVPVPLATTLFWGSTHDHEVV